MMHSISFPHLLLMSECPSVFVRVSVTAVALTRQLITDTTLAQPSCHAPNTQHLLISSRSHAVVVFVSFSISAPCNCFKHSLDYSTLRQLHEKDFVVIAMREYYANIKTDFCCPSPSPLPLPVLSPSPFLS